jgi:hypothetical protein
LAIGRHRRRLVAVVLVAGVAALGVAGLASRDSSRSITRIDASNAPGLPSSTTAVAGKATTTIGPATTAAMVTTTLPAPAFCPIAVGYVQDLRRMAITMSDPPQLRGLVQHASPAMAQSAASAPPEIRADVALLVSTIADYAAALDKAGYELAKLPPDMVMKLQTPPVQDAINHVDSYVRKACGPP